MRLAERIDDPGGVRSLDGDLSPVVGPLHYGDAVARVRAHPLEILLTPAGVHADEETFGGKAVDDDVVDHAAPLVAERAVLGLSVAALREVVRDQPLCGPQRGTTVDADLAHVRDVKHAGVFAHRRMLLQHPGVLHRHLEAGELDHAR